MRWRPPDHAEPNPHPDTVEPVTTDGSPAPEPPTSRGHGRSGPARPVHRQHLRHPGRPHARGEPGRSRPRRRPPRSRERLAGTHFDRLISSPLDRCLQTRHPVRAGGRICPVEIDDRFAEVDYGDWSGRPLKAWPRSRSGEPSSSTRPRRCSRPARAWPRCPAGRRRRSVTSGCRRDNDQTVLICSHGDVIKAILADALGMHLDSFQRIVVAPASISVIRYTPLRPFVERDQRHRRPGSRSDRPHPTADGAAPRVTRNSHARTPFLAGSSS